MKIKVKNKKEVIKMNMYQKRKERKDKRENNSEVKDLSSTSINWYIPTYGKLLSKAYK